MGVFMLPGGLFDVSDNVHANGRQETAFRYSVERINKNKKILNNSLISAQIEKIPSSNSFHTHKRGTN